MIMKRLIIVGLTATAIASLVILTSGSRLTANADEDSRARDVFVTNGPNFPVPVKVSGDDAGRVPVQATFRGGPAAGTCNTVYTVPSGRRLVIEYVAGILSIFKDQTPTVTMKTAATGPNIWLPASKLGPFLGGGFDHWQIGQELRAYSDAGNTVQICTASPFSGFTNGNPFSGDIVILGYTVSRQIGRAHV